MLKTRDDNSQGLSTRRGSHNGGVSKPTVDIVTRKDTKKKNGGRSRLIQVESSRAGSARAELGSQ